MSKKTISQSVQEFLNTVQYDVKPTTLQWYRGRLTKFVAWIGDETAVSAIDRHALRRYKHHLVSTKLRWVDHPSKPAANSGLSTPTINGHIRCLRRFFKWLVEEDIISNSPASKIKVKRGSGQPPKAISPPNFTRLLKATDQPRDRALLLFLADTGCRIGGAASLTTDRLDLDARRAFVNEKGNKWRYVFFGHITSGALGEWLGERPLIRHQRVFCARNAPYAPLSESGIYQAIQRLAEKANINGRWNPHSFRHAAARGWLEQGLDLSTVSQLLGHANVGVTADFYARWSKSELQRRHGDGNWLEEMVQKASEG